MYHIIKEVRKGVGTNSVSVQARFGLPSVIVYVNQSIMPHNKEYIQKDLIMSGDNFM